MGVLCACSLTDHVPGAAGGGCEGVDDSRILQAAGAMDANAVAGCRFGLWYCHCLARSCLGRERDVRLHAVEEKRPVRRWWRCQSGQAELVGAKRWRRQGDDRHRSRQRRRRQPLPASRQQRQLRGGGRQICGDRGVGRLAQGAGRQVEKRRRGQGRQRSEPASSQRRLSALRGRHRTVCGDLHFRHRRCLAPLSAQSRLGRYRQHRRADPVAAQCSGGAPPGDDPRQYSAHRRICEKPRQPLCGGEHSRGANRNRERWPRLFAPQRHRRPALAADPRGDDAARHRALQSLLERAAVDRREGHPAAHDLEWPPQGDVGDEHEDFRWRRRPGGGTQCGELAARRRRRLSFPPGAGRQQCHGHRQDRIRQPVRHLSARYPRAASVRNRAAVLFLRLCAGSECAGVHQLDIAGPGRHQRGPHLGTGRYQGTPRHADCSPAAAPRRLSDGVAGARWRRRLPQRRL